MGEKQKKPGLEIRVEKVSYTLDWIIFLVALDEPFKLLGNGPKPVTVCLVHDFVGLLIFPVKLFSLRVDCGGQGLDGLVDVICRDVPCSGL